MYFLGIPSWRHKVRLRSIPPSSAISHVFLVLTKKPQLINGLVVRVFDVFQITDWIPDKSQFLVFYMKKLIQSFYYHNIGQIWILLVVMFLTWTVTDWDWLPLYGRFITYLALYYCPNKYFNEKNLYLEIYIYIW